MKSLKEELTLHIYEEEIWNEETKEFEYLPFKNIGAYEIVDVSRWHLHYTQVVEDLRDGKLYRVNFTHGATEYQESSGEIDFHEVEPKEVTVTKYVKKNKGN